jgi:hypothetical protein
MEFTFVWTWAGFWSGVVVTLLSIFAIGVLNYINQSRKSKRR